jgi:glycosyltransferase involved in cell wall biosynthesis
MVHSSFATVGGAEHYVRNLSRALAERGHQARIFSRPGPNREPAEHLVGTRRLDGSNRLVTHLADLVDPTGLTPGHLAGFRPDVVHVHNWQGIGVLPVARLARSYPTCHTVHDYAICDPNNALAHRGRSAAVDRLLGMRSAWLVRHLREVTLLWPAERTRDLVYAHVPSAARLAGRVVPLAVPGPDVTWPPGSPDVVLFLGALRPHKGVDTLLSAWRAVSGRSAATLLIAGDGPGRDQVVAAGRDCPSIRYLGYLDEAGKARAMRQAGWLAFPSRSPENFSLVCVEALRAGRPIITTDLARPPMASDTSLISVRDEGALPDALRTAVGMPAARYREMAASAAADGRRLDWDAHIEDVIQAYRTLCGVPAA